LKITNYELKIEWKDEKLGSKRSFIYKNNILNWRIFKRLRAILENEDKGSREVVEGRMSVFFPS